MQVEYVRESEIEAIANGLLKKYSVISNGIVEVEELLENHLGLCLETFDATLLPEQKQDNVLGYIDFHSNIVAVHDSLLPENNPDNIGRYNFTLAHEIGHHTLHREAFMAHINHPSCFDIRKKYLMTKQFGMVKKPSVEWQADYFAACLLMPRNLVSEHWYDFTGSHEARTHDEIAEHFAPHIQSSLNKDALGAMHVKTMAMLMKVSSQALYIRLQSVNLITEHKQFQLL